MEINPTTLAALQKIAITSSKVQTNSLSPGQTLQATVVAVQPNQTLSLHIGNQILNVQTAIPLAEGQKVNIIVEKAGPQPVIKLDPDSVRSSLIQLIQRHNIATQQPLPLTLATLEWLNRNEQTVQKKQLIPPELQQAIKKLHQSMPTLRTLARPETLRDAIRHSGQFFEQKLQARALQQPGSTPLPSSQGTQTAEQAAFRRNVAQDFKAQLLRLIKLVDSLSQSKQTTDRPAGTGSTGNTQNLPPDLKQTLTNLHALLAQQKNLPEKSRVLQTQVSQLLQTASTSTANMTATATGNTAAGDTEIPPFIIRLLNRHSQLGQHRLAPLSGQQRAFALLARLVEQLKTATSPPPAPAGNASTTTMPASMPPLPGRPIRLQPRINPDDKTLSRETQWLSRLSNEFRAATSRIQLQQANNLAEKDQAQQITSMEIPYRDNEEYRVLSLRIMEEGESEAGRKALEKSWSVLLKLALDPLGPVAIKVSLQNERVSVFIWTSRVEAQQYIQAEMDELQEMLDDQGLQANQLACIQGEPPVDFHRRPDAGMVDFKA